MRKLIVLLLFLSFCGGTTEETIEEIDKDYSFFTPMNCAGDGVGCEKLYAENANIGWRDEENKYCDISSIDFTFENKFQLDYIEITNFQDDKFKQSAKPKNVSVFGPLVDGMQYGGFVKRATLVETKEKQYIYISEDWPAVSEIKLEIQNGHFTPTSVSFCGIQNIRFVGYEDQNG